MFVRPHYHRLPHSFHCVSSDFKNHLAILINEINSVKELVVTSHANHNFLDLNIFRDSERFLYINSTAKLNRRRSIVE